MKAVILAAGVGKRLGQAGPKCLLQMDGTSLLARHIAILRDCGVADIVLVTGYGAEAVQKELQALGLSHSIELLHNARFREGNIVSLWSAREILRQGEPLLIMDADVLYDQRLMTALLAAKSKNTFALDRKLEAGDEPMKICIRGEQIVDLRKRPTEMHDWHGESVGFFRCSAKMAAALASRADEYVAADRTSEEYEEAIRDLIRAYTPGTFGYADITGLPWTEIDFPEDVARARDKILPNLKPLPPL